MVYADEAEIARLKQEDTMPLKKTGVPPIDYERLAPPEILRDITPRTARLVIPIDTRALLPDVARMLRWLATQIEQVHKDKMKSQYDSNRDVYWATRSFNRACNEMTKSSSSK